MPGADGQLAPATVRAPGAAPWENLGRRQMLDLALPGIAIGVLCGIITSGALAAGGWRSTSPSSRVSRSRCRSRSRAPASNCCSRGAVSRSAR